MAGKEAVYFIIDVNPTMNDIDPRTNERPIDTIKHAIQLYIQSKLLFKKHDKVGIILCGTETHNELSELDPTQYQYIDNMFDLTDLKLNILTELDRIQCNEHHYNADIVDGIVVAMDSITKVCKKLKYTKRLFIFTNCAMPINDDITGIQAIIDGLVASDYRVNIIGFTFTEAVDDDEDTEDTDEPRVKHEIDPDNPYSEIVLPIDTQNKSAIQLHNEQILRYLAKHTHGEVFTPTSALAVLSEFNKRIVNQVSKLRGNLVFGIASDDPENSLMNISVHTFAKTSEAKFPTLKKVTLDQFDKLQEQNADQLDTDEPLDTGVLQERSYKKRSRNDSDTEQKDDDDEIIDMEMTIKSYRYGKERIPIDDDILPLLKDSTYKGISIIGFAAKSVIPRYTYIGSVDCIIAEPGNELAELAMSSLIHALYETDKIMLVRYVKRMNDRPLLGICTPYISAEIECLYFNQLPYAQDIRDYTFQSLSTKYHPSDKQIRATRDFINHLDLMTGTVDTQGNPTEALQPEMTFNPVLQHLYYNIHYKALNPNATIQPLPDMIKSYVEPDTVLQKRAETAINNLRHNFALERVDTEKNKRKRNIDWRLGSEQSHIANLLSDDVIKKAKTAKEAGNTVEYEQIIQSGIKHVNVDNPIDTFNILINKKDAKDTTIYIKQMIDIIHSLIAATGNSGLELAYECLITLRNGCIITKHATLFNELLYQLIKQYRNAKSKAQLITKISSEQYKIIPITDEEDKHSTYNIETAETFYDQFGLSQQSSQQQQYNALQQEFKEIEREQSTPEPNE